MGRKKREYTYEEYKKAMELLKKGYGLTETCRILGWPKEKVSLLYYWKHGIIPSAVKKVLGIRERREYTYEDYKKVMDMYKAGYKPLEIFMKLGIPINTIRSWENGVVPPIARWVAEPGIELAYVIGALEDGCVSKTKRKNRPGYEYVIRLAVIDKEFAIAHSKAMSGLLNKRYIEPWWYEKEKEWRVEYKSKAFYLWYKRTEEQGLEGFKPYIEHDIETVKYYLRGIYDGEGYNNRNKRIYLYNTKKELLEYVQYLLKKYFNIVATGPYLNHKAGTTHIKRNGEKIKRKHDGYYISINRNEHVQKYLNEIGFSIVRKQLGLKKHEKVFVKGIGYVKPYRLVELGRFKLPFSDTR